MPADAAKSAEQQSLEVERERIGAWWRAALAGQAEYEHPVYGSRISVHKDGDRLVVTGSVPSEEDCARICSEVRSLHGGDDERVHVKVEVEPGDGDAKGLLIQRLAGFFADDEQAGFAKGYIESHANVRPGSLTVLSPSDPHAEAALDSLVPEQFHADMLRGLKERKSILLLTVDETEAFRARQLLEEETKGLDTIVMPPERPERRATADLMQVPVVPRSGDTGGAAG
jgi:hypothetical protein